MANHSYVELLGDTTPDEVEALLKETSRRMFRGKVVVQRDAKLAESWKAVAAWWNHLPGTNPGTLWQPEDYGFVCWLRGSDVVEFRHPYDGWTRWAMSVFEHRLAWGLGALIRDDGSAGIETPRPAQFKRSYREYLARNFKKPLPLDDRRFLNKHLDSAPPPFRLLFKEV